MAGKPTIQEVFVHHFDEVRRGGKLSAPQQRAGQAIVACRTDAMGGHEQRCPDGHFVRTQYHSCRHRSCPTCAEKAKGDWLDKQQQRLLPCDHFHVIFTVPHELLALWRYNRRTFTDALFGACRDTLLQLLGQQRHLGATPGILMALHTWGRTLNQHPHIHCLVTAGGLSAQGEWRDVAGDYLLPAGVVKPVYRGKLLAKLSDAMRAGRLRAPEGTSIEDLLRAAAAKKWNVRLESRYGHGKGVAKYLSRYVRGGPIANTRIVGADDGQVRFRYKDHRDGKYRVRCLEAPRFVEHLLWHVPEPGQHTVRHVGLYAHACKERRERCRSLIDPRTTGSQAHQRQSWQAYMVSIGHGATTRCPHCGRALVRGAAIAHRQRRRQNSQSRWSGLCTTSRSTGPAPSHDPPAAATRSRSDLFLVSTRVG